MPQELVFALESADALRYALDRACVEDRAEHARWVLAEAQMLQYLAQAAGGGSEYPALSAGLADYAARIQQHLDARDAD
jgi:hypothetical protein